jgi:2-amino-4-hydroxy-6-hydroxymethyldihydropteridine diphosphokinase
MRNGLSLCRWMETAYLLLGTNLGDKQKNLLEATRLLGQRVTVVRKSSVYRSEAWGGIADAPFFNQVLEITTLLSPEKLLRLILQIEKDLGRERKEKWGNRIIDIDILLYGNRHVDEPQLKIPHPQIPNRRFALLPLQELCPTLMHPILNHTVQELVEACTDPLRVERL